MDPPSLKGRSTHTRTHAPTHAHQPPSHARGLAGSRLAGPGNSLKRSDILSWNWDRACVLPLNAGADGHIRYHTQGQRWQLLAAVGPLFLRRRMFESYLGTQGSQSPAQVGGLRTGRDNAKSKADGSDRLVRSWVVWSTPCPASCVVGLRGSRRSNAGLPLSPFSTPCWTVGKDLKEKKKKKNPLHYPPSQCLASSSVHVLPLYMIRS